MKKTLPVSALPHSVQMLLRHSQRHSHSLRDVQGVEFEATFGHTKQPRLNGGRRRRTDGVAGRSWPGLRAVKQRKQEEPHCQHRLFHVSQVVAAQRHKREK